jgi:hypothetical protein
LIIDTYQPKDGNCAWPGVLSFVGHSRLIFCYRVLIILQLKVLKTPFQQEFVRAPDVPWPAPESHVATVRAVGDGAGNMTYILIADAGHFVGNSFLKAPKC